MFFLADRYFIVLDDIWDESVWRCINCAQVQNTHGSKVVTTTRNLGIANLCRSPGCVDAIIHELHPLSDTDAQNLFYNKVFGEERCPYKFMHISGQFFKKMCWVTISYHYHS